MRIPYGIHDIAHIPLVFCLIMPELPEVEVTRRALHDMLHDKVLYDISYKVPALRYPLDVHNTHLLGQKLLRIERRGKYMLWHFNTTCYILHLGMSGRVLAVQAEDPWKKHEHIQWVFAQHAIRLTDPRRFGFWIEYSPIWHKKFTSLGPEPLDHWDVAAWIQQHHASTRCVYQLLMDQNIIAGLGNIYTQEALFYSKIHPQKLFCHISSPTLTQLAYHIKEVLKNAIAQGGTTLRDHRRIHGSSGYFQIHLAVYGRAGLPCHVCQHTISSIRIMMRTVSFCANCQPIMDA